MRVRILVILTLLMSFLIGCGELGLFPTDLSGEILILSDDLNVGSVIPLGLLVDDKISELHKEIWEITYVNDENLVNDTLINSDDLELYFTEDEILDIYRDKHIEIYYSDNETTQKYSDRITFFIPDKPGKYLIEVMGYYKTSSPRKVTEKLILIVE